MAAAGGVGGGGGGGGGAEEQHSSLSIKLKRIDRIYRANELVEGTVIVRAKQGGWSHNGIALNAAGGTFWQHTPKRIGLLESFQNTDNSMQVLNHDIEITGPGRIAEGVTEIPFEFPLTPMEGLPLLLETYHGVFVNTLYRIHVTCDRGVMKKKLEKDCEFVVEVPAARSVEPHPKAFTITPGDLENVRADAIAGLPQFRISAKIHRTKCPINLPFTGEVIVEESDAAVKSIEMQLVRVESVTTEGRTTREATEIQNIQIGDGDVCRQLPIPMYMIFPRLFTCSSVGGNNFQVDYEVNLIVIFADGYMITENVPISLHRV